MAKHPAVNREMKVRVLPLVPFGVGGVLVASRFFAATMLNMETMQPLVTVQSARALTTGFHPEFHETFVKWSQKNWSTIPAVRDDDEVEALLEEIATARKIGRR